jgi:hypothetical protein
MAARKGQGSELGSSRHAIHGNCPSWKILCNGGPLANLCSGVHSRIKKVKCLRPTSAPQCEACRIANIPCLYGDRDRYQAERGLSYAYGINGAESSDESSLKRKIPNHHQSGRPLSGNVYTSPTTTASTIATDASPPPSDRNQVHPDSSRPPTTAASTSDLKRITVPFFR